MLQKFDIWPIIVRVDYSPHHVDLAALKGGKYTELVNFVPWKVNYFLLLSFFCNLIMHVPMLHLMLLFVFSFVFGSFSFE